MRPPIPENCIFEALITSCWDKDPEKRPAFTEIVQILTELQTLVGKSHQAAEEEDLEDQKYNYAEANVIIKTLRRCGTTSTLRLAGAKSGTPDVPKSKDAKKADRPGRKKSINAKVPKGSKRRDDSPGQLPSGAQLIPVGNAPPGYPVLSQSGNFAFPAESPTQNRMRMSQVSGSHRLGNTLQDNQGILNLGPQQMNPSQPVSPRMMNFPMQGLPMNPAPLPPHSQPINPALTPMNLNLNPMNIPMNIPQIPMNLAINNSAPLPAMILNPSLPGTPTAPGVIINPSITPNPANPVLMNQSLPPNHTIANSLPAATIKLQKQGYFPFLIHHF